MAVVDTSYWQCSGLWKNSPLPNLSFLTLKIYIEIPAL